MVTVVTKEDITKLPMAIEAAVVSGAVSTISGIEQHVADVLREHMWTELAPNWAEYIEQSNPSDIAQVLITRLARVLEEDQEKSSNVHPSHRYVYPPASSRRAPGDVLRSPDREWWVTLTPACDFAQTKVEFVLLAHAMPLEEHPKYLAWKAEYSSEAHKVAHNRAKSSWKSLQQDVLSSTRGRFHFLPKFREIPDLVIDLENVRAEEMEKFASYEPVASLASPFAESLLVQHSHLRGRIGVPDLDVDSVKARLVDGVEATVLRATTAS